MTLQRTGAVAVLAAALVAGVGGGASAVSDEPPGRRHRDPVTHTVRIDGTRFQPASLDVRPGDTVVWKNDDMFPHTATSKAAGFDSGAINPGESWRHQFRSSTGDAAYVCLYHPTMTGVVRVRQRGR